MEKNKNKGNIIPKLIQDNKTMPVVDYNECLFEKVFVETPVDTDGDGKLDLVAVYIRRPKETLGGFKVPAIYVANPYMMFCNEELYVPYDVNKNIKSYSSQNITPEDISFDFDEDKTVTPSKARETEGFAETAETEEIPLDCISDWYSYFNSRGYASVFCGGLGTRGSEGITLTGSREEILAFKAVIDWLNGRCRAFTDKESNIEIKADWCSGNVAMSGKSYLGTMCIGVATTGVEGLKTIIPEAAISNWFAYDRCNGLNLPPLGWQGDDIALLSKYCCSRLMDEEDKSKIHDKFEELMANMEKAQDRESGNYNKFWDERNYLNLVDKISASVFIVHGLNDWNVKTNQCIPFWKAIEERNIARRMMLHQGEHIYIHNLEGSNFNKILHSWLDFWLYDIENGEADIESKVWVQSNIDQKQWFASTEWGEKLCQLMKFPIDKVEFPIDKNEIDKNEIDKNEAGSSLKTFKDDLTLLGFDKQNNNFQQWRDEIALAENPEGRFIKYLWETEKEIRISGEVKVSFKAMIDKPVGILSAMLVDYGEDCRLTGESEVVEKSNIELGKNAPTMDTVKIAEEKSISKYKIITRGWLNTQNRQSIIRKEEIILGEHYEYNIEMVPMDYVVKKGHKLGLIIYGTDPEATERQDITTTITVNESSVDIVIPIIK